MDHSKGHARAGDGALKANELNFEDHTNPKKAMDDTYWPLNADGSHCVDTKPFPMSYKKDGKTYYLGSIAICKKRFGAVHPENKKPWRQQGAATLKKYIAANCPYFKYAKYDPEIVRKLRQQFGETCILMPKF